MKIFLIMAIGFGSLMLLTTIVFGEEVNIRSHLNSAVSFGFFMSITFVSLHAIFLRARGAKAFNAASLSPLQKKSLTTNLAKENLKSKLLSLQMIRNFQATENEMLFETVPSLSSWGEKISISITPVQDGSFEYFITSKPLWKTTLVDFGKNFQNIRRIEKLISTER